MMDSPANGIIFKVGHRHVRFGIINARVRNDFRHICVSEGSRCLGHDGWLVAIAVGFPEILFHLIHFPGELF